MNDDKLRGTGRTTDMLRKCVRIIDEIPAVGETMVLVRAHSIDYAQELARDFIGMATALRYECKFRQGERLMVSADGADFEFVSIDRPMDRLMAGKRTGHYRYVLTDHHAADIEKRTCPECGHVKS